MNRNMNKQQKGKKEFTFDLFTGENFGLLFCFRLQSTSVLVNLGTILVSDQSNLQEVIGKQVTRELRRGSQ